MIISVTSETDQATKVIHPIGNLFTWANYRNRRSYPDLLENGRGISQAYFRRRTPGHNKLLAEYRIAKQVAIPITGSAFSNNVSNDANPERFHTDGAETQTWRIQRVPTNERKTTMFGYPAKSKMSRYWIIRVPEEIIDGHNDIWNSRSRDMMAAFFNIARSRKIGEKVSERVEKANR